MKNATILLLLLLAFDTANASSGAGTKVLKAKRAGYYDAETTYPQLSGRRSALAKLVNGEVLKWAKDSQRDFVRDAEKAFKEFGKPSAPYEYRAEHKVTYYFAQRLVSMHFKVYRYTGGAHGNTEFVVFNFGRIGGKMRRLSLADFFREGAGFRQLVADSVIAKLKRNEAAAWVASGEFKEPTEEQLERFVIDPDGLRFLFNPYEVGPYAAGTFEVKLTLQELGRDFNREMLLGK